MPREKSKYAHGKNPNTLKNLDLGAKYRFKAGDKQGKSENGKKGAEVRTQNIIIKERLEKAIRAVIKNEDTGLEEEVLDAGLAKLVGHFARTGYYKDLEVIAEHLGQKPAQKVEQLVITPEVDFEKLADLRKALKDD